MAQNAVHVPIDNAHNHLLAYWNRSNVPQTRMATAPKSKIEDTIVTNSLDCRTWDSYDGNILVSWQIHVS